MRQSSLASFRARAPILKATSCLSEGIGPLSLGGRWRSAVAGSAAILAAVVAATAPAPAAAAASTAALRLGRRLARHRRLFARLRRLAGCYECAILLALGG